LLNRLKARMLLSECTGHDIWPTELCRDRGVPADWIEELSDCYESGFRHDRETVYVDNQAINQFHGIHDLQLAYKLAEFLGVDPAQATATVFGREAEVQALQDAADEN